MNFQWNSRRTCLHESFNVYILLDEYITCFIRQENMIVLVVTNAQHYDAHTQITKPADTDFEQSMLSMFDNKKATNLTQNL